MSGVLITAYPESSLDASRWFRPVWVRLALLNLSVVILAASSVSTFDDSTCSYSLESTTKFFLSSQSMPVPLKTADRSFLMFLPERVISFESIPCMIPGSYTKFTSYCFCRASIWLLMDRESCADREKHKRNMDIMLTVLFIIPL